MQMYRYVLATYWANDEDVRRALHVEKVCHFPFIYTCMLSLLVFY